MIYAAIDPGESGAIAVFDDLNLIHVEDIRYLKQDKQLIFLLDDLVNSVLYEIGGECIEKVFVEQVNFVRGQGGVSSFSFGQRFGEAKTLARFLCNDVEFIAPLKWKNAVGLKGHDKKASAIKAAKIYPAKKHLLSVPSPRAKDGIKWFDGRGDAVMIGLAAKKLGYAE